MKYVGIMYYFIFYISISEIDALPTIPTQHGQTVYLVVPIYFVLNKNLVRVLLFFYFYNNLHALQSQIYFLTISNDKIIQFLHITNS